MSQDEIFNYVICWPNGNGLLMTAVKCDEGCCVYVEMQMGDYFCRITIRTGTPEAIVELGLNISLTRLKQEACFLTLALGVAADSLDKAVAAVADRYAPCTKLRSPQRADRV